MRETHILERSEIGTGQDIEKKQASKGYLPPGEGEARTGQDMERQLASKGHPPTGGQRSGLVRTPKGSKPPRGTHCLESAEVGTGPDMERKKASKEHLLSGDGRG